MEFDDLAFLRGHHAAWRLLRADNAPLVLSFLGRVFVEENARATPAAALETRLADELYALNARLGEGTFPRPAKAYLDDWATPDQGWLRKFYPPDSDEAHVDATPALETAYRWVTGLRAREFVGTESRLHIVVDLLRQIAYGAETDPGAKLAELHRRRAHIDAEIAAVERGEVPVLDDSALRDRYQQFTRTALELLSDFREVEQRFRDLDQRIRERIAGWDGAKGDLLQQVVGDRSDIADSDEGRSFGAFYDFLLSRPRQEELSGLIDRIQAIEALGTPDPRMGHVHHDWLDAAEQTQHTVRVLSEQLRRFLDDQVWLENRRVMDLLRSIEAHALAIRHDPRPTVDMGLDSPTPTVVLPMERPLYAPRAGVNLDSTTITDAHGEDVDATALLEQVYVDPVRLTTTVRDSLRSREHVTLGNLLDEHPVEQGIAEVVGYLALEDPTVSTTIDETAHDSVDVVDASGRMRTVTMPRITYSRRTPHSAAERSAR